MTWGEVWAAVHGLAAGMTAPDRWRVSVDGLRTGTLTGVDVSDHGVAFAVTLDGREHTLAAAPGSLGHARVTVDGSVQPAARLVFSLRHQLLRPLILVFEFRNVALDGAAHRVRFDHSV